MDTISFSNNWNNKLSGHYYTTVRLASSKYQVGKVLSVALKGKYLHKIKIIAVTLTQLHLLNNFITCLDMGMDLEKGINLMLRMYPTVDFKSQRLVIVLCEVIKESIMKEEVNEKSEVKSDQLKIKSTPTQSPTILSQQQQEIRKTYSEKDIIRIRNYTKAQLVNYMRSQNG